MTDVRIRELEEQGELLLRALEDATDLLERLGYSQDDSLTVGTARFLIAKIRGATCNESLQVDAGKCSEARKVSAEKCPEGADVPGNYSLEEGFE